MKNRMKKILTVAMVSIAAMLLLVGCGSKKNAGSGANSKPAKIVIFQSKVEITDDLKALAKEYKKEKGVTVEIWGTTGDDYITQAKTKLSNRNSSPNIFSTAGGQESQQLGAYMADLSKEPFVKNIAKDKAYISDGKVLGLPYSVEGYGLAYNTALVKPDQMKSTDDFINFLKQAKSAGKYSGFELSQESFFLIGHMLNTAFAVQKDPLAFLKDVESGKTQLQNVAAFKDLAKIYEAIRQYTPNPLQVKYDTQIGDLMTGKVAMINQGMWINTMTSSYKNSDVKLEMMPFPIGGNDKLAVGVPLYWNVNKNKPANEVKASEDFLNWLVSSKTGQNYIVNKFKFIPAMTNIKVDEAKMDTLSKAVYESSQKGNNIPWSYGYWPVGAVDTDFVPIAQKFFTDKSMTGTELMKQISVAFVSASQKK
ncbi:ABC transporter substrate-binding protein [Schleiferilactobacillus harbinensis]|uniref:ABC transporter substrate-binding protein n=1 Tax=Schleiferilactobacillus harbinensis TaxID=304207 RepID=A0ABU7T345_9LACO